MQLNSAKEHSINLVITIWVKQTNFIEPFVANSTVINVPPTMDVPNEADGLCPSKAVVPTPQKRHSVLSVEEDDDEEVSCVYGEKERVSFWLGGSYKHLKTGRQTCSYWVDQWCAMQILILKINVI